MNTPRPRSVPLAALMGAALALGACGSDGDGGDDAAPSDDPPAQGAIPGGSTGTDAGTGTDTDPSTGGAGGASRFGVIGIEQSGATGVEEASIFAGFFSFDRALPIGDLESSIRPAPDTCTVTEIDLDDDSFDLGLPDLDDVGFASLGAGDAIVVTGPGGTYATLPRRDASGFIVYATEDDTLPVPVPAGLAADIPGDDFPAFAEVPIPDVTPLTGVSPAATEGADENTTFRWDAAGGGARVDIDLSFVASGPLVSVTCSAVDDGEFALPASARERIPDGERAIAQLSRTAFALQRSDDAVLFVTHAAAAR